MKIEFSTSPLPSVKTDLLLLPILEGRGLPPVAKSVDGLLGGVLSKKAQKLEFKGREGETIRASGSGKIGAEEITLIGLGPASEVEPRSWIRFGSRSRREGAKTEKIALAFPDSATPEDFASTLEGFLLAGYEFKKYKSDGKPGSEPERMVLLKDSYKSVSSFERASDRVSRFVPGVFLARDLVNEPASVATPRFLAAAALRHCAKKGLKVEVWDKKKIEKEKMAGILAVSRGSQEEPRLIKISFRPSSRARKKVFLVGKGVTFDSGGLSLKPPKAMETMKVDMSGGAAVIGTMAVLPDLGLDIEVEGYIPATENLPSGSAQKPGDVIRYQNGKTVEVLNTDAEGRLILADALSYAAGRKPDYLVDLATLTGACVVALGGEIAGIMGNDDELIDRMIRAGRESDEKIWRLPLPKEYREELKSSVADIKNIGGGAGGAITAALFLQEFVGNCKWVHLDIAGPAFNEKESFLGQPGATGFGVRTLVHFLRTL